MGVFKLTSRKEKCSVCNNYSDNGEQPYKLNGKPICASCIQTKYDSVDVVTKEDLRVVE